MKHSASLLIQDSLGAFLVLQRGGSSKRFQECWEFPGGKIDAGESPAQALLREVREEASIEAVLNAPKDARYDRFVVVSEDAQEKTESQ